MSLESVEQGYLREEVLRVSGLASTMALGEVIVSKTRLRAE